MPPGIAGRGSLEISAPLSFSIIEGKLSKGSFKPCEEKEIKSLTVQDQENEWWLLVSEDAMPLNRVTATYEIPTVALWDFYKAGGYKFQDFGGPSNNAYAYGFISVCGKPGHTSGYDGCPHCGCKDVVRARTTHDANLLVNIEAPDSSGDTGIWAVQLGLWRCRGCRRFFPDKLGSGAVPSLSTHWKISEPLPFSYDHIISDNDLKMIYRREKHRGEAERLAREWAASVTEEELQLAMEGVRTSPRKSEYIGFAEQARELGKYNPQKGTGLLELESVHGVLKGAISDSRRQASVKYSIESLVLAMALGMMRGHMQLESIVVFCEMNSGWMREHLGFETPPSLHAFKYALEYCDMELPFQAVNSFISMQMLQAFELLGWVSKALRHIAMDGKKSNDTDLMTMGFWCAWRACFLAYISIDQKSSEAAGIMALIRKSYLSSILKDAIVSADAISCTRRLSQALYNVGAIPVFGAKGNTGGVYDKVGLFFNEVTTHLNDAITIHFGSEARVPLSAWAYAAQELGNLRFLSPTRPFELLEFKHNGKKLTARRTVELSHGGVWTRTYIMSTDLGRFPEFSQISKSGMRWVGLKSVVSCHSVFFADEYGAFPRTENRLYFTGLDDIAKAEEIIVSHWGIENAHLRDDRLFRDDFTKLTADCGAANQLAIKRTVEHLRANAFALQQNPRANMHLFVAELSETDLDGMVEKVFAPLCPRNFNPDASVEEKESGDRKKKSLKDKLSPKSWAGSKRIK
jgi:hypothetical protein